MVVVEVAASEARKKLLHDIRLWLGPARGKANVAFAIKASQPQPLITIDMYEWDKANGQPTLSYAEIREVARRKKLSHFTFSF